MFNLLGFGPDGWGPALLQAALMTLALSTAGFLSGVALGVLAAFARLSGDRFARGAAFAYGALFRGVPDLLTIYLLYFGGSVALTTIAGWFGARGFVGLPGFATGAVALGVISGAYQAEVYRGAYLAIHRGELEAARAYGMSGLTMLRRIVAPQTLRYAMPGLGNVWQLVIKDSALVSVIGLVELMRQAQVGAGSTRQPFVFFCAAAALYLAIATSTNALFRRVERHSHRGLRTA
jgi:octopine/nopaline transport system permease protein